MHEALLTAQDRPAEPARNAVADDEVVDLKEGATVAAGLAHAAAPTELE